MARTRGIIINSHNYNSRAFARSRYALNSITLINVASERAGGCAYLLPSAVATVQEIKEGREARR